MKNSINKPGALWSPAQLRLPETLEPVREAALEQSADSPGLRVVIS